MASPIAHSLTGAAIYFAFRHRGETKYQELWWLILAANLADFDLLPGMLIGEHSVFHRTFSHSILASLLFAVLVYAICRWQGHPEPRRITLLMFAAYLSQLLLDWLSVDPGPPEGIPLLWPFTHQHFVADPALFLNIERDRLWSHETIVHNLKAALLEIALLGPPAVLAWWWSRRR
jgi:membrane-bound metal-dependent hydrolase YbcI (DUF457 family)